LSALKAALRMPSIRNAPPENIGIMREIAPAIWRASEPSVSGHRSALNKEFLTEIFGSNKRIPK
jgi:hypothetical protein